MEKVVTIGRWPLYGGQNEWGKALLGLTKVAFIERWPYYRVATIRRFHCSYNRKATFSRASLLTEDDTGKV